MAKKAKRPSWFKLWLHHKSLIEAVPDEVVGRAIKAALAYFATGEVADLGQLETVVFAAIKSDIDEAHTDYLRDVENGKKGGRPKMADKEKPPVKGNVIKLRKAGSHRNVGSSFFITILEISLDKCGEMCGLFANCD